MPSRAFGRAQAAGWLAVTVAWGAASLALLAIGADAVYRAAVILSFVLVCPGMALVRIARLPAGSYQLALGIAVSMGCVVLVPAALLYAGAWSTLSALVILVSLTVAAAATEFGRSVRNAE
jgi:hypothetical protein